MGPNLEKTMTATNVVELATGLKTLIETSEDGNQDAAIVAVCEAIKATGIKVEIDANDDEADDMNSEGSHLWVVSTHRLLIGGTETAEGEEIAEWTRCACGHYGQEGNQVFADSWTVDEDTNGGDQLPDAAAIALDALGLEDTIPDVEEPALASEEHEVDEDGEYAVYWETVGDDAHVVARYTTLEAAQAVAEEKSRGLAAKNPGGNLLCGYGVRVLENGKWVHTDAE
jgi:hypothetical protein